MIRIIRLKGPTGGPAVVSICLVEGEGSPGASGALSERERELVVRRTTAAAKADFIAGRAAAHALLGEGVEVLRAPDGRPVPCRSGRRIRGLSLSIGHSRGCGLAGLVSDPGWVVGVDIETRSTLTPRLSGRVLTTREKRRVGRAAPARRARAAVAHWVLKEAALKTMGGGVARLLSSAGAAEVIRWSRWGWGVVAIGGSRAARARLIPARGLTMAVVLLPRR